MKKLFLSMALVLGFTTLAKAAVQPPLDLRGNSLYTVDFVGALGFSVDASTGTTATLVTTGRGEVFGVVVSSDTNSNWMVFRDSATANTSSQKLVIVGNQGNGATQATPATVMQTFPRPIQFLNGLSINMIAAPPTGALWTVVWRPLKSTE